MMISQAFQHKESHDEFETGQVHSLWRALDPISTLLGDHTVSEILIVGATRTFVERAGQLQEVAITFPDAIALEGAARAVARFMGRRFDQGSPLLDGRLPDGSRIHIAGPPASRDGICMSIRRPPQKPLDIVELVRLGTMTEETATDLVRRVADGANVLVSGGTGSGKTTLLAALASCVKPTDRIVVIEDAAELKIARPHVVHLETVEPEHPGDAAIGLDQLLRASLRMRPDRLIVGEVRGSEAITLVQATNTGHKGCMGTIHADSPAGAVARMEALCLMGGLNLPRELVREQISMGFDIIVQIERLASGQRKVSAVQSL